MLRPLYPRGKNQTLPIGQEFGGPQGRSGLGGEEKEFALFGNRTPAVQPVA
jgi:hypothetical protein